MSDLDGYSEPQAARILGYSTKTLQRWRRAGAISHYRTPGGRIRYSLDNLANFQAKCRVYADR